MKEWIRVFWRFFYFITSAIYYLAWFGFLILTGKSRASSASLIKQQWLKNVPHRMGIRAYASGNPYKGTCLFVANHISYIDPILIWQFAEANVVAKAEVKRWLLIGLGGYIIGTIFVKRENKSSRRKTVEAIWQSLEEGRSILVFPEGTTTAGKGIMPFRPRSFEAAFKAGAPVQPISITYANPHAAFIGRDTFIPHFFRLFRADYIESKLVFGPVMTGPDTCEDSQRWIMQQQLPVS